MRKQVMFIVGLAAFVLIAHEVVAATKLTSQQVENVCGKKLKAEATGVSGCFKGADEQSALKPDPPPSEFGLFFCQSGPRLKTR